MLVESQQEAYLAAAGMTGELGKICLAPFVCGSTPDRSDAILRRHLASVLKAEAVAQLEPPV